MRWIALVGLALALSACRGSDPYTQQDLAQVKLAWTQLRPTYEAFKAAFKKQDTAGILYYFQQEKRQCRLVDVIDSRDTIDPNVKLFLASIALDDICNNIESAEVLWAKEHHRPYDKAVQPSLPSEVFFGIDDELKKVPGYLRHPADLA